MRRLVASLFLFVGVAGAFADDWPQWMGTERDGVWREGGVRTDLSDGGGKVLWRVPVGLGYAGPAVAEGKVYVTDFVLSDGEFDGRSQGGQPRDGRERILCLSAETGEELWKHAYEVTYTVSYPGGPRVTPTVVDDRLYFQGTMGHFWCLDANSGEVIWTHEICKEYGCRPPRWGYASHPLVHGDLVYALAGGDDQVLVAFDRETGEERWKALSAEEAGYCPPKVVTHAGVEQLLFWYPEAVVSLNPASGKPYWSHELKPIYGISRMAPQLVGDKLFAAGPGKNVAALLELDPDKPGVRELWRGAPDKAVYPVNPPPQMRDGVIYGVDGELSALIAVSMENGERLWSSTAPTLAADAREKSRHGSAFLVYHEANEQYWIFGEAGDLILAELSAEGYKELGRQHLVAPTNQAWGRPVVWTHPAFAERSVFVRNDKEIIRVDLSQPGAVQVSPVELKLTPMSTIEGTERWDWWQARTAAVPGEGGQLRLITTMSETGKTVSHDFHDIYQTVSDDHGETWSPPELIESLQRQRLPDGYEVAPGDLWPTYHVHTHKVLMTGKTFNFRDGKHENRLLEKVCYAVMDPGDGKWGSMRFLELPEKDHAGHPIIAANAGNHQRVDLANGEILLPVRYERDPKAHNYTSIVCRCAFDGETLIYKEHGSELGVPEGRGLYEPSLTTYRGRYFLTLRADHSGFVTRSDDGLRFDPVKEWTFDDGKPLGSYNTQQHWVTVGGELFLVYTRRGADNDHVFRHRAPLFIAQVDPERLEVIRSTERILLPENGATLGNSGICRVSDDESWVTCGEGLLRLGKRKGELNQVLFVKITVAE